MNLQSQRSKLEQLKAARQATRKDNRKDVYKEATTEKVSLKEARQKKLAEKLLAEEEARDKGLDVERVEAIKYTIEDVDRWNEKQAKKEERADKGFTDYTQIAAKKYQKMIQDLKPNLSKYQEKANASVESNSDLQTVYRGAHSLAYGTDQPSQEAVDRLVAQVQKQDEKRRQFSRRRPFNEDGDVSFINDKNERFNKKIAKAFDKYTSDIKESFERGTAL